MLKEIRQIFRRDGQYDNCFFIASGGCAATTWLAANLSRHPDILCSGGAGELADIMHFLQPTPEETERVAEFNLVHMANAVPKPKPFRKTFSELKQFRKATFFGNVHMYNLETLFLQHQFDPLPLELPIANIIRHPITRLQTHYNYWMKNYHTGPSCKKLLENCLSGFEIKFAEYKERMLSFIPDLENNEDKKIFMYSLFDTLNNLLSDFYTKTDRHVPIYRMEDLKAEPEIMSNLIKFITRGAEVDKDFLGSIYTDENMKVGRYSGRPLLSEVEQYLAWGKWQQYIFKVFLDLSKLEPFFKKMNYRVDFVV